MLAAKENHTWMIEEKDKDKVEALEVVELVEGQVTKTTRIGTTLSPEMRAKLFQFLKENLDVFALSHEDMPGIAPEIIQHKLNVNPDRKPIQQKRRVFALEWDQLNPPLPASPRAGFSPPRKGDGAGMGRDFRPAPRGGAGMGLHFLDLPRPIPAPH